MSNTREKSYNCHGCGTTVPIPETGPMRRLCWICREGFCAACVSPVEYNAEYCLPCCVAEGKAAYQQISHIKGEIARIKEAATLLESKKPLERVPPPCPKSNLKGQGP